MPSGGKLFDSIEELPVPKTFPGSWVGNLPDFLTTVSKKRTFIETVAALPGGFGTVHAIRLGIEPFAE